MENPVSNGKKTLIKLNYPQEYEEILQTEGKTWYHKLYNYMFPGEHICPVCGKPTRFLSISRGYQEFCSVACVNASPETVRRRQKTTLERYGVDNATKLPEFVKKAQQTTLEKYGDTCVLRLDEFQDKKKKTLKEKYGVEHALQSKEIMNKAQQTMIERHGAKTTLESPVLKEQVRQTVLERYGVEHIGQSEEIHERSKKTCQERYGADNPFASKEIQDKIKKTMMEIYDVENPSLLVNESIKKSITFKACNNTSHSSPLSDPVIKNRIKETNIKKYGVENPFASEDIKSKIKETNLRKYGVEYPGQSEACKDKISIAWLKKAKIKYPMIISLVDRDTYLCKCPHPDTCNKCQEKTYQIDRTTFHSRQYQNTESCTKLLPVRENMFSTLELKVRQWLDDVGVEYTVNDRSIIPPKEVDIYIPSKKLAVEINGFFWHSDRFKKNDYHLRKWQLLHDRGVQMLTLWEDQLLNHEEIMHNILLSKLGVYERRVGARKCSLRQVPGKEARAFLDQFHLQGHAGAKVNMGLYYQDTLVSLMTFGHRQVGHGWDNRSWELVRYCCRAGWQVVGGPSRQLRHFIKEYRPDSISSFSSNDISDGGLYTALGFESAGSAAPGYWYIDPEDFHRYHRYTFTKDQILHKGLAPSPDKSTWTERQVMDAWGYVRIYDSGQSKWILECRYE